MDCYEPPGPQCAECFVDDELILIKKFILVCAITHICCALAVDVEVRIWRRINAEVDTVIRKRFGEFNAIAVIDSEFLIYFLIVNIRLH